MLLQNLILAIAAGIVSGNDLETVRLRALAAFCWPSASGIQSVVGEAIGLAAALDPVSCLWHDIDYNSTSRADWLTDIHLARVQVMTTGVTVPGSSIFENVTISALTHCALQAWFTNNWQNANWWYQWIGVPLQMSAIQIMFGENRTSIEEQNRLTQYNYDAAWWLDAFGGGDNLSDMAKVESM